MAVFERDILQAVEMMSINHPGVIAVISDDGRVVFVGGEEVRLISGMLSAGEYLDQALIWESDGFEEFYKAIIHADAPIGGYYESSIPGKGDLIWHGNCLESDFVILTGTLARECGKTFYEPGTEIDSLRNKERTLSNLLGNLPGMAYRCRNDVDWTMEFVSDGCLELTGYSSSDLLGNSKISYADLILPEYRAHVWECVQEAVQDDLPFEIIYKIRSSDGVFKWVWEKGGSSHNRGESVLLEGFITDITPLMEAEQALHRSEERFRLMAEKTGQLVYDLDLVTEGIIWSGAVQEISGKTAAEFKSVGLEEWKELIHPEDRAKVLGDLDQCIREIKPFLSVYRFRQKDGSYLYVEDEGDFSLDTNGRPVRMVGSIKNYSNRMRVQELMIQSEKMITVASLSAGMAHEINNPLGVISQSAQNIERRLSPQLSRNIEVAAELGISLELINRYLKERSILDMLEAIKDASTRAAGSILKMLNFSRKSSEEQELCDLAVVVDRAVGVVGKEIREQADSVGRHIEIIKDMEAGLPKMVCFQSDIERVVVTLLRNTIQGFSMAEPDLEGEIVVRGSSNSAYVVLEIEDNGPGIDENTRRKVFEPFFATTTQGMDSGFELSIAYFIVTRNHGGTITVDSELGKGTCFTISLPLGSAAGLYVRSDG